LQLTGGRNGVPEKVDFAKETLEVSSHPNAFPGEAGPRITSIAMTLLAGKTEALLGVLQGFNSGVQAKPEMSLVFRAVSATIFFFRALYQVLSKYHVLDL
jgi:hypothetical protein